EAYRRSLTPHPRPRRDQAPARTHRGRAAGAGEERKSQGGAAAPEAGKVTGSRFFAPTVSRFLQAEAAAVSRFLVRHPKLSRFVAHIPGASKFLFTLRRR